MAKDLSQTEWHGVKRKSIPWFPSVNSKTCIGCELCYVTCGREVYEIKLDEKNSHKAVAEREYNCMVGCSTCAMVCPVQAITFPNHDIVWKVEKENKIFKKVHKEAEEKRAKQKSIELRVDAENQFLNSITKVSVKIAGMFGEKMFLVKLEDFIENKSLDIVNLKLEVPTIKGIKEKTPSFMVFDLTSTNMNDIQSHISELKKLVHDNELIWVEDKIS